VPYVSRNGIFAREGSGLWGKNYERPVGGSEEREVKCPREGGPREPAFCYSKTEKPKNRGPLIQEFDVLVVCNGSVRAEYMYGFVPLFP
jgi:hypothetical protein